MTILMNLEKNCKYVKEFSPQDNVLKLLWSTHGWIQILFQISRRMWYLNLHSIFGRFLLIFFRRFLEENILWRFSISKPFLQKSSLRFFWKSFWDVGKIFIKNLFGSSNDRSCVKLASSVVDIQKIWSRFYEILVLGKVALTF